jgi:bifunctional non-homologous end joining protein LigD
LHGKKLKGQFALVKAHGRGDNAWLLIKLDDEFASTEDVTLQDKSVLSRKTVEQIGNNSKDNHKDKIKGYAKKKTSVPKKVAAKRKIVVKRESRKKFDE